MTRAFPIAPMDTLMTTLTVVVLSLPPLFLLLGALPGPTGPAMVASAAVMVVLVAAVWLCARPLRYEVGDDGIRVVFPTWTRHISAAVVRGVTRYPGPRFRDEVGWGMRVGVGGLFGSFGLLLTSEGTLEMTVTRVSDLVVVHLDGQRDLLVSPEDWDAFALAVEDLLDARS